MIVLRSSKPKARKKHKCNFCCGIINVGEVYDYQANVHSGEFYEWKSHIKCSKIASELDMYDQCDEGVNDDMFQESVIQEYINLSEKQNLDIDRFEDCEEQFLSQLEFVQNHYLKEESK